MRRSVLIGLIGAPLAVACSAGASIVNTTGAIEWVLAPSDAQLNAYTSATSARVWDERQSVLLMSPLRVDAITPGVYDQNSDLIDGAIQAGTVVNSHYFHLDSPGSQSLSITDSSITFADPILGVIVSGDEQHNLHGKLDQSDFLGMPGTMYMDSLHNRGFEMGGDRFSISADGKTLTILKAKVSSPGDFMRVMTAVPAPAGVAALAGLGLFAMMKRQR